MTLTALSSLLVQACLIGHTLCATPTDSPLAGERIGVLASLAIQVPGDTIDEADVVSSARAAQATFERRRIRHLPVSLGGSSGSCDEVIGRICTTYDEGEWYPTPEADAIVTMRGALLTRLDSLQRLAPGSDWILGQRVWYRVEAGDPHDALEVATACGDASAWWCHALTGFSLHALGQYGQSLAAFEDALELMDEDRANQWRVPRWSIDSDARKRLEALEDRPLERQAWLDRLWVMADPLFLAPDNDRLSEHYSRWTASATRSRARNPFLLPWGSDLEQLTVRNGWEMGWERRVRRGFVTEEDAVGHQHPEGRDFMPPGRAVDQPEEATAEELTADRRSPRSLYAPAYAPVLLPMDAQVAVFPRGERTILVASHFLPPDTTYHVDHAHPRPWMTTGPGEPPADRIGLFAVDVTTGRIRGAELEGRSEGGLLLDVPTGPLVLSAESWSPSRRRAGRIRVGVAERRALEDLATLSDIVLLRPGQEEPESLRAAVDLLLPSPEVRSGERFAIGWEVAGLGFRAETLRFHVSVERTDRSFFGRLGGLVGLGSRPQPLELSWEEPSPDTPGHDFHYLGLGLPALEPGDYRIRLVLRTTNRSDAVSQVTFRVRSAR